MGTADFFEPMSYPQRILRGFDRTFLSRPARAEEWNCHFSQEQIGFNCVFFVERTPLEIEVSLATHEDIQFSKIERDENGERVAVDCTVTRSFRKGAQVLRAFFPDRRPTTKVSVLLSGESSIPSYEVKVRVLKQKQRDRSLLIQARSLLEANVWNEAVELLHEYEHCSSENPRVCRVLGDHYKAIKELDVAERYYLKSAIHGGDDGQGLYASLQQTRSTINVDQIRDIEKESSDWFLEPQHGIVVLDKQQEFVLEVDGYYLQKSREIVKIIRPAAARMMRRIQFSFAATKELLLYTDLNILHPDNKIEKVADENFVVSDAQEKNVFIAVEDERMGNWIMPDLTPGDVFIWSYHLLRGQPRSDGKPHCFIRTSLFNERMPTFRAQSRFLAPKDWPGKYSVRQMDPGPEERDEEVGLEHTKTFVGRRYHPAKHTGFAYENNYLNPLIICSEAGTDWPQVAREASERSFGTMETDDELPVPLKVLMDEGDTETRSLELAYYWIRDKLKYASLKSAHEHIGRDIRAKEIAKAGTGDCKDKSYLLALACRQLEIPYEFVAISVDHGILFEDHPADQFDHVFVRAKIEDKWIYLDAANALSPFGSVPAWCQGLQALALNENGSIITLPHDDPRNNLFSITEIFHSFDGSWLEGEFELRALGHTARSLDDHWKTVSLAIEDQEQAAQESLKLYLPLVHIKEFSRLTDTSSSNLLHIKGRHRRCPVAPMGRSGTRIGRLSWDLPALPTGYWRTLQLDRMMVANHPIEAVMDVVLKGAVRQAERDLSRLQPMENAISRIDENVFDEADHIRIRRSISFKRHLVREPEVKEAPATMERIEQALQLVIGFAGSGC